MSASDQAAIAQPGPAAPPPSSSNWLSKLGPGLVTGAADDDPSGIATYSQAGAQFGFGMAWTMVLTFPLMVAIQLVCAQIGRVSGHGLATNCLLYTSPSPRDRQKSRMPSSA